MARDNPVISIIIPTYNHAPLLQQALQSVLEQTFPDWEAVVINNFSQDNTIDVVESFREPRFRLINYHNHGIIGASRNEGVRQARGEIVSFLDSDDIWFREKLERVVSVFRNRPGVDLVCHHQLLSGENRRDRVLRCGPAKDYPRVLMGRNFLFTSAVSIRCAKYAELGGFSEDPRFVGSEDFDLWLRAFKAGCRVEYLPEVLGVYRVHQQNISAKIEQFCASTLQVLDRHFEEWQPKTLWYRYLMRRRRSDSLRGAGRAFLRQGDFPQARRFSLQALVEDPLEWRGWVVLALSLLRIRVR